MPLDNLDRYILRMLQEDSRTPFTKIAEEISSKLIKDKELKTGEKIPDTTIHFRVKKLRDNKIINRFTIDIHPKAVGFNLIGIAKLIVGGHIIKKISLNRTIKLASDLSKNPLINFVGIDEDGTTIHILMLTRDRKEFMNIIEKIRKNPDVDSLEYHILSDIKKGEEITKPVPI
jgi:DNA-binding Lrp family transcriptional regulator